MPAEENQVYLDHLVPRMNLRYKRSAEELPARPRGNQPEDLPMSDLGLGEFRPNILRKPDFQRATNAWQPEDCVALLESVVNRQVIPSVIMWYSADNGFEYVLDGGHRISVVMAWVRDDWGDRIPPEILEMMDEERLARVRQAANEVRQLVQSKIGSINDYIRASEEFDAIVRMKGSPGQQMDETEFQRALFYNDFRRRAIKFEVQWVEGNYEIAEKSFIKINKSGRQLSAWETKLIENRDSSFARAVMSITSPDSLQYYWPDVVHGHDDETALISKITAIKTGITGLTNLLFEPRHRPNNIQLQQPMMTLFGQDPDKKPYWIAEILTVTQRGQGTSAETEKLLERDNAASPEELISNGFALTEKANNTFEHLAGRTPHSLGIVPSLYFYTRSVRYVRSLLYGFIYWLLSGSENEILTRKRLFCGHRKAFEYVLLEYRDEFTTGLSRKSGSGSEVTVQTASYYQEVIKLLIEHDNDVTSSDFEKAYRDTLKTRFDLVGIRQRRETGKSRNFTARQKAAKRMDALLASAPKCEICGGIFDPASPHGHTQHDHRLEVFKGGQTVEANQRLVHNFCNNQANREAIEKIASKQVRLTLPGFYDESRGGQTQLRLFEDDLFL